MIATPSSITEADLESRNPETNPLAPVAEAAREAA